MGAVALAHSAPYTIHDLFDMPSDDNRYEVLDGQLIVSPAPSVRHQRVASRLAALLEDAAPAGIYALTAVAVRCGEDDTGMIPDVVVTAVSPRTAGLFLDPSEVLAVAEVISPSSRRMDRVTKPDVYAAAGISAYWRVELDPFRGQEGDKLPVVLAYTLTDTSYSPLARISAGSMGQIPVPFPVELDPDALLD